jgi:alpha-tubulin suppressor-like RCC1 family protein
MTTTPGNRHPTGAILNLALLAIAVGCGGSTEPTPAGSTIGQLEIISAGDYSTCVTNDVGGAFCWGENAFGQLGDGTLENRRAPVSVSGGLSFASITAGDHACGVTVDSRAFCWGKGTSGELGNGATSSSVVPVPVAGGFGFETIMVGSSTCGFRYMANVYCWGPNGSGQLGTGDFADHNTPAPVTGGLVFARFAMGSQTACGSAADGTGYCWGNGADGELGNGSFGIVSDVPVLVHGGLQFGWFSVGGGPDGAATICGAALDTYCWGSNAHGQLGDGTTQDRNVPGIVDAALHLHAIVAGRTHACGLGPDEKAYCWGAGGLLGNGTTTSSLVPVPVVGSLVFATLTAGAEHTCGRTDDTDEMFCWGKNSFGQLGDGTTTNRLAPVKVRGQS